MCCKDPDSWLEEIKGTHWTFLLELCLFHEPGRKALGEQPLWASRDLEKQIRYVNQTNSRARRAGRRPAGTGRSALVSLTGLLSQG